MFTCSQANTFVSVSYLDLPDLSSLTQAYPELAPLVADPILNHDPVSGELVQVRYNNDDRSVMRNVDPVSVEQWYVIQRIDV